MTIANAADILRVWLRQTLSQRDTTMATAVTKEIRIFAGFGLFFVQTKDNNGEWVSAEADGCSFATREDAKEYIDQWLRMNSDMKQAEDLIWFV